jgi:hypothetical protein
MRQQKIVETTLGDLIVSVTDEVMPFVPDPSTLYLVVSCVLTDLLAHEHRKESRGKYSSHIRKARR